MLIINSSPAGVVYEILSPALVIDGNNANEASSVRSYFTLPSAEIAMMREA